MIKTYSFADHRVILSHPDVGTMVLSDGGIGRVTVSYSGENSRITKALDGSVVINKIVDESGSVNVDVLQTSDANNWLKKYVNFLKNAPTARFALGTMLITGLEGEDSVVCNGVVPTKHADIVYDQEAQNRTWAFNAGEIVVK